MVFKHKMLNLKWSLFNYLMMLVVSIGYAVDNTATQTTGTTHVVAPTMTQTMPSPASVPTASIPSGANVSPIQVPSDADLAAKAKADADAKAQADADAKAKADSDAKAKADADAVKKAQADVDAARTNVDTTTKALNDANIALAKAQSTQDLVNAQVASIAKAQIDAAKILVDSQNAVTAAKSHADLALKTQTDAQQFLQTLMPSYQTKDVAVAVDKYCQSKSPCPSACVIFNGKCRAVCNKVQQQDICNVLGGFGGACSWSNNVCINN